MARILRLVACAALWASSLSAQGDSLYTAWCSRCHGADARGTPAPSTKLEVPPADLASCAASTAETEDRWIGIVTRGGAAFGLSLDMPAYGEGATPDQIRTVVRYVRSLCRDHGWPPGELNFARGFLIEKAFPENELIAVAHAYEQQLIYERRLGRRFQFEAEATTVLDSLDRPFEAVTGALKYNIWHSLEHRALATLGLEVTAPLGRRDRWELAPYLSAGVERLGFTIRGRRDCGCVVPAGHQPCDCHETSGADDRRGVGRAARRPECPFPLSPTLDQAVTPRSRRRIGRRRGSRERRFIAPIEADRVSAVGFWRRALTPRLVTNLPRCPRSRGSAGSSVPAASRPPTNAATSL